MPVLPVTSEWGFFASLAAVIALATLFSLQRSKWQVLDQTAGRLGALDGLRGVLSYAVFAHHAMISYFYGHTLVWRDPPSAFYSLLGNVPVAAFFQLTGFLFWRKVLAEDGAVDWGRLIAGRVRRLTPAYLLAVVATLVVIAAASSWKVEVDASTLGREVLRWFSFGFMWTWPLSTNGLPNSGVVNSVLWTLAYEWRFYLLLPVFALFRKDARFPFLLLAVMFIWPQIDNGFQVSANFAFGMLAARLVLLVPVLPKRATWALDVVAIGAVYVLFTTQTSGYNWPATLLVAVFVHALVFGGTLFGILNLRGLRLLGATSYSIYLLHSVVLFLCLWPLRQQVMTDQIGQLGYIGLMTGIGAVVLMVSMVAYKFTEEPFLHLPARASDPRAKAEKSASRAAPWADAHSKVVPD